MMGYYNSWGTPWGSSWKSGMMGGFAGSPFGIIAGMLLGLIMLVLIVWTLYWKYKALWYAAKHDHKWWFIAVLVINTMGILEILYLYYFSKRMDMPAHEEKNVPMVPPQG